MTKHLVIALGIGVSLIGFQNCSSHHEGSTTSTSNSVDVGQLQSVALQIMANKCASCHSPGSGVTSPIADILDVEDLLFQGYVVPGEPQNSDIYLKAVDGIMPQDQPQLTAQELDQVRDWILALGNPDPNAGVIGGTPPPGGGGGTTAPTFSVIFNTMISPRCVSCHSPAGSRSQTPLHTYAAVMAQVNVSRPTSSPLYAEVANGSMPVGPSKLTTTQVSQILAWIQAGAPNN